MSRGTRLTHPNLAVDGPQKVALLQAAFGRRAEGVHCLHIGLHAIVDIGATVCGEAKALVSTMVLDNAEVLVGLLRLHYPIET